MILKPLQTKGLPSIWAVGDGAITMVLRDEISPEVNERVFRFTDAIESEAMLGVNEVVPAYCSLTIYYNPLEVGFDLMAARLRRLWYKVESVALEAAGDEKKVTVYHLPTAYGGEFGPDLEAVSKHAGLSTDKVVELHKTPIYRVYMLGFSPGFPYLGGMDERIVCPRLKSPRGKVPAGSVGIADKQTGVYPAESPGGWRIIGRTPVKLFDINSNPPALLKPGTYVRFIAVPRGDYEKLKASVRDGEFALEAREEIL